MDCVRICLFLIGKYTGVNFMLQDLVPKPLERPLCKIPRVVRAPANSSIEKESLWSWTALLPLSDESLLGVKQVFSALKIKCKEFVFFQCPNTGWHCGAVLWSTTITKLFLLTVSEFHMLAYLPAHGIVIFHSLNSVMTSNTSKIPRYFFLIKKQAQPPELFEWWLLKGHWKTLFCVKL